MFTSPSDFPAFHMAGVGKHLAGSTISANGEVQGKAPGLMTRQLTGQSEEDPWKVHIPGMEEENAEETEENEESNEAYEEEEFLGEDLDFQGWDGLECPYGAMALDYADPYMASMGQDWWASPMMDMWTNAPNWLQAGDIVCFHGLQQTTSLNGTCATVQNWDEASCRWCVVLESGTEKFAKPENLAVVQAQACSFPYAGASSLMGSSPEWYGRQGAAPKVRTRTAAAKGASGNGRTSSFGSDSAATTASGSTRSASQGGEETPEPEALAPPSKKAWTTVMMRNIPNDYTGTMLLDLLNEQGFEGHYHLVYLPMDYHRKAGFGYAFIDFVTTQEAQRFRQRFEGFSDWGLVSHKICNVSWSDALQGVQAHVDRYRNSPVMHEDVPEEFKPMLFANGKQVPFPAPTKSIRPPRLRKKDPRQPNQVSRDARRTPA